MSNSKRQTIASRLKKRAYKVAIAAAIIALGAGTCTAIVRADSCSSVSDCQSQISNLSSQNGSLTSTVDQLQQQASSYQDAINLLQQQISAVEAAITANQNEQALLQQKIADYQQKITLQKQLLGEDIKAMYVNGGMSSIEMLASSDNLSQYVDQQEYRGVIQSKIQSMLNAIAQLEAQVKDKESQVAGLIQSESDQKNQLAADQAQQTQMLNYNQQQQDQYNSEISSNNQRIASLRAKQAQLNLELSSGGGRVVAGDPGHGGYPNYLAAAPKDSLIDPWGMYNRECVSYTAWKVQQTFGYMPYWGGNGNANQWPGDARAAGIPTGSTPKVHSVAIWNVGYYGHAMWVEAVNSDGSIWVSQYNYSFDGNYSEMLVEPSMASQLTYIYFGG